MLYGDFNTVRFSHERKGGPGSRRDLELFGDLVRDLNLVDLPLKGQVFTWSNKRDSASFTRLVRFLVSSDSDSHFPFLSQSSLPVFVSDHSVVMLDSGIPLPRRRIFRFEKMWADHISFDIAVALWWDQGPVEKIRS